MGRTSVPSSCVRTTLSSWRPTSQDQQPPGQSPGNETRGGPRRIVAARCVVDAKSDEVASFPTRYGYRPIPGTRRLVRTIGDFGNNLR